MMFAIVMSCHGNQGWNQMHFTGMEVNYRSHFQIRLQVFQENQRIHTNSQQMKCWKQQRKLYRYQPIPNLSASFPALSTGKCFLQNVKDSPKKVKLEVILFL